MRFPETQRVIYDKNPLETVICQLRFPPILKIDSEPPADFQDKIRSDYPLLKEQQVDTGLGLPTEMAKVFGEEFSFAVRSGRKAYDFSTEDAHWQVSLTRDFIALTAKKYRRWEDFNDHLKKPLEEFQELYAPAYYTRIGLRYRDVIQRSALDLKGVAWAELLQPHITGELGSPDIASSVQAAKKELLVNLDGGKGQVRIKHGLIQVKDSEEPCYLIDADFFSDQKTEVGDARERFDHFNREAGRLFKWCIKPRLHQAMGPHSL